MTPDERPSNPNAVDMGRLRALLEPVARSHGVCLVDVEWTTGPGGKVLRVVIERPGAIEAVGTQAGVTLEDCVRVSRDASTVLDVADLIARRYQLEVSSPGLDRPLRSGLDFARHLGRVVKIRLHEPAADGQRVLRGTLRRADSERLRMEVDGNEHVVELGNVAEARAVVDFGGAPKARGGGASQKRTKRSARPGASPSRETRGARPGQLRDGTGKAS
jgi:ribosome maturation factor RimP